MQVQDTTLVAGRIPGAVVRDVSAVGREPANDSEWGITCAAVDRKTNCVLRA
jgi:hypothetical protein